MRIITIIAAAVAAFTFSQPASAPSASDLLRVIDSTRYNRCASANGVYKATCQANRAGRVVDVFRTSSRQNQNEASSRIERRISLIQSLQRACDAGDAHSCQRVGGGLDDNRIKAARALMDACRKGDAYSCERAETVLVGTDGSYGAAPVRQAASRTRPTPSAQQAPVLAPNQARIGNCLVDIDPETGGRTSGAYGCTR